MAHYAKGANAERELIHLFFDRGFAVVRIAGSGKTALPAPDLLALSKTKKMAFECKAWNSKHLAIPLLQMEELIGWCEKADIDAFVAWKVPRKGWLFLKPEFFKKTAKNYMISLKEAFHKGLNLNVVAGVQATLPS
ncbi:MAG: Holliday junction resolvase Hjc [Candidatus Diapherotrites archaeon]